MANKIDIDTKIGVNRAFFTLNWRKTEKEGLKRLNKGENTIIKPY